MKQGTFILMLCCLASSALGSWPDKTYTTARIVGAAGATVGELLKDDSRLNLTAADYRDVTIVVDPEGNQFDCTFPIAYYEVSNWLSLSHEDAEHRGWSRSAGSSISSRCGNMDGLLGILDQAELQHERISVQRTERKSGRLLAIWNKIRFTVPIEKKDALMTFLRDYYASYRPDSKVYIYIEKGAVEQTAPQVQSEGAPSD